MSKIVNLKIKNFRGIKTLDHNFSKDFICLVGRGDTGKTTILEAISYVLSPTWNISFCDTDFYNCNTSENIEIETTITDIPKELIADTKYGLYLRSYNKQTKEITDVLEDDKEKAITIKLVVDSSLEPHWFVISNRGQAEKIMSANDREKLHCFLVSDYIDRHFSWNKGGPLYSLLLSGKKDVDTNIILNALRETKSKLDEEKFESLGDITKNIKNKASAFGLDISQAKTALDFKDIMIKEGKLCLHDDKVPFRLRGKGSKRILSIAIQLSLVNNKGVALIDEVEQGLEPDRIKQIVRTLKEDNKGQIFITTHSRDAIIELDVKDLIIVKNKDGEVKLSETDIEDRTKLQGVIRACPEAFFAKKVIVCEGATEIGLCRALDNYRKSKEKEQMAYKDCYYVDGTGSCFVERGEKIKEFKDVCVLKDADTTDDDSKNQRLQDKSIEIFSCDSGNSIEKQVFNDLPWVAIEKLIEYVKSAYNKTDVSIRAECSIETLEDNLDNRKRIGAIAGSQKWFKRIDHGEFLGKIIFEHFDEIEGTTLHTTLKSLSDWIDADGL